MTWRDPTSDFWGDPLVSVPPRIQAARDGLDVAAFDQGEADAEALDLACDEAAWEAAYRRSGGYWHGFYQALVVLESSYSAPGEWREYQALVRAKDFKAAERWAARCAKKAQDHRRAFRQWWESLKAATA